MIASSRPGDGTSSSHTLRATYILPIRAPRPVLQYDLDTYLRLLSDCLDVVVVDGSDAATFAAHHARWSPMARHVPVDPDLRTANGKVGGVLTGVRHALYDALIVADDDVRYTHSDLTAMVKLLEEADVVRPQNYFDPLPWHARWDTARALLNRGMDGDWPGTLGVRRSILMKTGGYDGDVLFENLELVRTVRAAGGREHVARDLMVRRLPPTTARFLEQRVRQAYDELARPVRFVCSLSPLPLIVLGIARRDSRWWVPPVVVPLALAEVGRRRERGRAFFPFSSVLLAPLWAVERAICSWLAVYELLAHGGVSYGGSVLPRAGTPMRTLQRRYGARRASGDAKDAPVP